MFISCLERVRSVVSCAARIAGLGCFATLAISANPASAQSADLVVNQADSPDPGPAGGVFTYTIRVDNNGPDAAAGVNFADTIPPGSTFVGVTTTQGTCNSPSGGVVDCALGNLAYLANATVTIQVILPAPDVYTNTVSATSGTTDPNTSNNLNVTEATTAQNATDMALAVVGPAAPVNAGTGYTYVLTATNNGPLAAASQTIAFSVPAGACVTSAPTSTGNTWSCVANPAGYPRCSGTITCTRNVSLAAGASAPNLTVPAVANVGGSVTGAFTVSSPLPDGNTANNTVTATATVNSGYSDVSITKTATPATVGVGSDVTYTVSGRLNGGGPAGAVPPGLITITDTLGAGLTLVSATGSGWICGYVAPVVTCTRPGPFSTNFTNMPDIAIVATVTAVGIVGNTATIAAPELDPVPANNTASVNVTGSNSADLSMTKTVSQSPVVPGYNFTYTITPRNNGPAPVAIGQTVTVTDAIPAGISVRAAVTGTGWTCTVPGAPPYPVAGPVTVTCTRTQTVTLAANTNFPAITVPVVATSAGTTTNTACVALTGTGPSDGNAANDCANRDVISTEAALAADLRVVSKTANPNPVQAGQDLTYVITVQNDGPGAATNVTVTDALASLVATGSFQSATPSQGTCTPSLVTNGTTINLSCNLGTLTSGASATITVVVRPSIATTGNRTNTAIVTSPDVGDSNRNNNSGAVTSQVIAVADVTVTKTDTPDPAQAGTPLTYVITARNNGPSTASAVVVTDTLPANASFLSLSATTGSPVCATPAVNSLGGTLACTWASIANGVQQTATVVVRPLTGAVSVQNDVAITTTTVEPNTGNNSATATTAVTAAAVDLVINKVDSVDPVALGQMTKYTITVSNGGPSFATNIVMTDSFPTGSPTATFSYQGNLTVTPAGSGTCVEPALNLTSGTLTCTFTGLASGSSAIVTYDMRAESISGGTSGTAFNSASVIANEPESQASNNSTTHSTTSRQAADLALTKSAPATVIPGSALAWMLNVTNNGPATSNGAQVTDTLPAGVTFVSASPGCALASGTVTCTLGTLANGASAALTINVTVNAPYTGASPLANSATVTTVNEIDTVPANNSGSASTTVTAQADLAIAKTVNSATPSVGSNVTFTLTVTNRGPNDAIGAQVSDLLPAGYAFVSATPGVGSYVSGTGVWAIGALDNGASATLAITATVLAAGPYLNSASVMATTQDPTPGNNTASAGVAPVALARLAVTKTDGSATYTPGGNAIYVVTVTNAGPSAAGNVTVADALPAGLTLTAAVTCTGNGVATCGTVTGSIGQAGFGTTGATLGAAAGDSLVFTVPVAFAAGMTANPLVNTATATDVATGATADGFDSDTLEAQVSLSVVKTDGSATYTPGGTATYTVTVANGGLSTANSVMVADAFPAGVTLTATVTCVANGASNCGTVDSTAGQSSFGAVAAVIVPGAGNALVFTVPVAFAGDTNADPLVNTATATDGLSGATGSGSDSNARTAQVTLTVGKTDNSAIYTPGGTGVYVVTVGNTGASDALDVAVNDALPVGVTLNGTVTCAATGIATCGNVTGTAGQSSFGTSGAGIGAGAANSLVFAAPVAFAANLTDNPLVNTATATDLASGATGSGSDSNTLSAQVSLVVTKSDGGATYTPGGSALYEITVRNSGVSDAVNVTIGDALPAGVTLAGNVTCVASGNANCGTVTGTAGQTSFGATGAQLAAGPAHLLTFQAPVAFAANLTTDPLENTATVTDVASGAAGSATDSNTRAVSGATLSKTIAPDTIAAGGTATLTLVLGNDNATALALTAAFTDAMPAGVTTTSGNTGTCAGATVDSTLVTMAAGATIPPGGCTIVVTITSTTPGTVTNTTGSLQTGSGTAPPASAPITVMPPVAPPADVDLAIVKQNVGMFFPGQIGAQYAISVSNVGTVPSSGPVTVTDVLPAGLTATAISGTGWNCTQPVGPCARSDPLAPGASYPVITLTVNVDTNLPATLENVANMSGGGDVNGANNSARNIVSLTPVGPEPAPVPAGSPAALALLALMLAILGGRKVAVKRCD